MYIFKKGDPDYQDDLNSNFSELNALAGDAATKTDVANLKKMVEAMAVSSTALWKGVSSLNSSHTVTPSKALSDCKSGWLLVFAPYDTAAGNTYNYDFTTLFIPKNKAGLYIVSAYTSNYTWANKRADISNTKIVGHSSNVTGDSLKNVLVEVWEV